MSHSEKECQIYEVKIRSMSNNMLAEEFSDKIGSEEFENINRHGREFVEEYLIDSYVSQE